MGYAIMQIKDANGNYVDWDGRLQALPDGTLGQIVVKKVMETNVLRAKGIDIDVPASQTVVVVTHSVPVGQAHKVFGYGLSPEITSLDFFQLKKGASIESKVYVNTYEGGIVDDYVLVDNRAGGAPVVVTLEVHNSNTIQARKASGFILVEDVTNALPA
jgi:hypothetical protein